MKLKLEIPDYISIANFRKLATLEHLSGFEKLIETVHMFTSISREEIRKWDVDSISQVSKDLVQPLDSKEEFYPVLEFKGTLYGYSSIKKMTLGEYIDLERLCKDPIDNLETIAAILYRPITKNKITSLKYQIKNGIKVARGEQENIFKYYEIEDYDVNERDIKADEFKDFPVQYLNGAMSFFLAAAVMSSNSIQASSVTKAQMKWMKVAEHQILNHLRNIGDGLRQFINSQKPVSLTSQEIKVLQS